MSTPAPVVAITGASAGVGRATAQRFAKDGAKVGMIARGRAGLDGAAKEVEQLGGTPHVVQADVADPAQVEAAADEIERELGPIDIWINDAMVTVYGRFEDLEPEEFERVTDVTYLGSVYGMMAALRRMKPRRTGRIIQVGSALGYRGIPLQSAYCGAKHALNGVIDSLRTELKHDDIPIQLTVVQLPGLNTPQFLWGRNKVGSAPQPMPPIFQPEVAAEGIHYATYSGRREVWVGAPTVQTIIGNRVSSGLADEILARQGFSGQKASRDTAWEGKDNLFEPVDEDQDLGTHGPFTDQAKSSSVQLLATRNRGALAAAGVVAGAAAAVTAAFARDGGRSDTLLDRVLPWRS